MSGRADTRAAPVAGALADIASLGERIVEKRIRLARLEARALTDVSLRAGSLVALGVTLLAAAWAAGVGAFLAAAPWPLAARLAVTSAVHAAAGVLVLVRGVRRWRGGADAGEPDEEGGPAWPPR